MTIYHISWQIKKIYNTMIKYLYKYHLTLSLIDYKIILKV